jgi:hypothetical protein
MAGLLDDALEWMQSPERTQQLQQVGGAISGGLLNIQSSKKRFDELQAQAFGDPKNPLKVTDPDALNQLTEMTMSGPMAFVCGRFSHFVPSRMLSIQRRTRSLYSTAFSKVCFY